MNETALSAWRVDEPDFPSGGSIEEKLRFAVNYAILAPSSHNTQPWRFLIQRDTVQVCAGRSRALPVTDPFDRELLISCAAALFNLRAALSRFGCAYDITTFPYPSEPDVLALLRVLPQGQLDREIAPLVAAATDRLRDLSPDSVAYRAGGRSPTLHAGRCTMCWPEGNDLARRIPARRSRRSGHGYAIITAAWRTILRPSSGSMMSIFQVSTASGGPMSSR